VQSFEELFVFCFPSAKLFFHLSFELIDRFQDLEDDGAVAGELLFLDFVLEVTDGAFDVLSDEVLGVSNFLLNILLVCAYCFFDCVFFVHYELESLFEALLRKFLFLLLEKLEFF
jgi:hypothetical protein